MRLPRDLAGRELARLLGALGYEQVRQTGSHIRLTNRSALRVGTLAAVVADLATHHGLSRDEVVNKLFGIR